MFIFMVLEIINYFLLVSDLVINYLIIGDEKFIIKFQECIKFVGILMDCSDMRVSEFYFNLCCGLVGFVEFLKKYIIFMCLYSFCWSDICKYIGYY